MHDSPPPLPLGGSGSELLLFKGGGHPKSRELIPGLMDENQNRLGYEYGRSRVRVRVENCPVRPLMRLVMRRTRGGGGVDSESYTRKGANRIQSWVDKCGMRGSARGGECAPAWWPSMPSYGCYGIINVCIDVFDVIDVSRPVTPYHPGQKRRLWRRTEFIKKTEQRAIQSTDKCSPSTDRGRHNPPWRQQSRGKQGTH